jgi:hypothetical protein
MAGTGSLIYYGGKMSHFLWVEDFAGTTLRDTTVNVFGELLPNQEIPETKKEVKQLLRKLGVFVELSFLGGLDFIRNPQKLSQVDYIILDIWLDVKIRADKDENNWLPQILQEYYGYEPQSNAAANEKSLTEAKKELFNFAGYQLYVELVMEHGFPKDHILFCSDNADEQKNTQDIFKRAKIELPLLLSKDEKANVQAWIRKRRENPYYVLRRGIINGCQYVQALLKEQPEATIQFDEFVKTDNNSQPILVPNMLDYLETLQNILPLRAPKHPQRLYKLFVRSLAHEWDVAQPYLVGKNQDGQLQAFGWIMKNVRNWAVHKNLFENLTEKEVAFLFLINMRAMFQLEIAETKPFEKALLSLFDNPLSQDEMLSIIKYKNLNLAKSYSSLKWKGRDDKDDVVTFVGMLNNLVNRDKISQDEISHSLFQMFWHGLSRARVNNVTTSTERHGKIENAGIWYTFQIHDYGSAHPNSFLFQLARHIYSKSKLGG